MTNEVALPLAGVTVVDLTSNIAAPFSGAILADLGADVTHVESITGDDSRRMSPRLGDESAYWHVVNRNKDIARLDIRLEGDRQVLDDMIAKADVFITNLRPGKLEKNGLDGPALRRKHPRLIHAALSAYGVAGPERDRAGYDAVLQSRTGIAEVTGTSDGPPVRAGVSVLDVGAGTWLALGIITALLHREKTGTGTDVSTSLFETGANWVAYHVAAHQISGDESGRFGSGHPAFSPYGIFATRTDQVCIGIGGDDLFRRLCEALNVTELVEDERFATNVQRVANDPELRGIITEVLSEFDAAEVVLRLDSLGVACDIVQKPEALLTDRQSDATSIMIEQPIEGFGPLKFPGLPLTFGGIRPNIRRHHHANN